MAAAELPEDDFGGSADEELKNEMVALREDNQALYQELQEVRLSLSSCSCSSCSSCCCRGVYKRLVEDAVVRIGAEGLASSPGLAKEAKQSMESDVARSFGSPRRFCLIRLLGCEGGCNKARQDSRRGK